MHIFSTLTDSQNNEMAVGKTLLVVQETLVFLSQGDWAVLAVYFHFSANYLRKNLNNNDLHL